MDIKELIRCLRCFDETHHVIVDDYDYHDRKTEKEIAIVKFDGRNCVIELQHDY